MVDQIKARLPEWLNMTVILGVAQMLGMLAMLTVWAVTKAETADRNNLALAGVETRLGRIFDTLDTIRQTLPVMQERIAQGERAANDARGVWASADLRLRAIEQNAAANHEDINQLARKVR